MKLVRFYETLSLGDLPLVGGKNASLGELCRLGAQGIRVPDGFAVTVDAYRAVVEAPSVRRDLHSILARLDLNDLRSLRACGAEARALVGDAPVPGELVSELETAYAELSRRSGERALDVAVRSSATAEDLPEASFAGQQETYLNVRGFSELLASCRRCFASLFTDRAISYRTRHGVDHERVRLSVGVQRMVRSDLAGSGVMFTLDTESGFRGVVLITAAYGLGETIVQGLVNPDEHVVFKATQAEISRTLGSKEIALVYDQGGGRRVRTVAVPAALRARPVLSSEEVIELARMGVEIERHYSALAGEPRPMDVEWAKDGRDGRLYVLQARPETAHARRAGRAPIRFRLREPGRVLARGRAVGLGIGAGPVMRLDAPIELERFAPGSVLVTAMTDPDWEPILRRAAAIVTDRGGRTCHAAIVSRELGIPCVVGTGDATRVLASGAPVTVSCAEGESGLVMEGLLAFDREEIAPGDLPPTRTKICLNVGDPQRAFELSFLPVDGVGLAREEFIIQSAIGIHPMALVHPERVDEACRREIERRTAGYPDPGSFFVAKLAEGIARIAAAFHPRPVVVRLSDFKTNEYARMLGGEAFEPEEENPMLGLRGAARYVHPSFREAFALECQALRRVRGEMGLRNVIVMVPFCRTIGEAVAVQQEMARHGLARGQDGLELYVMCEIPSNVWLIDQFAQHFDGFSIGSNDLTQLVLGVDRDSALLAPLFDERDPAVGRALVAAIEGAHAASRPIGICGQAPSDHPEVAELLVRHGIDSLSLSADAVLETRAATAKLERALAEARP